MMCDSNANFECCKLCFHTCGVNRLVGVKGRCALDGGLYVSSVCLHKGEEPALGGEKGVCNVFFNHCNLQCLFCQNWQISARESDLHEAVSTLEDVVLKICAILDTGVRAVGFVSPTPYIPYVRDIITALRERGYAPVTIYNTNAFDTPAALSFLAGFIDVYLPDYKYGSAELGQRYSQVPDYPERALESISEMVRQVGKEVIYDDEGLVLKGTIVRHLVLPNHVENSRAALFNLWSEFGNRLTLSLMSQYTPLHRAGAIPELARTLLSEEYNEVVDFMYSLGFKNGWVQELSSVGYYVPDFTNSKPF